MEDVKFIVRDLEGNPVAYCDDNKNAVDFCFTKGWVPIKHIMKVKKYDGPPEGSWIVTFGSDGRVVRATQSGLPGPALELGKVTIVVSARRDHEAISKACAILGDVSAEVMERE